VVEAGEVQHAVQQKNPHLVAQRVAEAGRLARSSFERDGQVAGEVGAFGLPEERRGRARRK
jgi:hypothetical protein